MNRTMDATFLNHVANHPDVRPHVGGVGVLALQEKVANPNNIALVDEHGGFLFEKVDVGLYELHTMYLPEGRGAHVLEASALAARYMFAHTDAVELITKLPVTNRRADFMVRRCGFRKLYERKGAWVDGSDVLFFGLDLEAWRQRDDRALFAGREFHVMLEAAKDAVASKLDRHPIDPAHDRVVGAAVLMIRAGQVRKGVWSYNRWASVAGYQQIRLLSDIPPVVDVVDAVVTVTDGKMEILLCL